MTKLIKKFQNPSGTILPEDNTKDSNGNLVYNFSPRGRETSRRASVPLLFKNPIMLPRISLNPTEELRNLFIYAHSIYTPKSILKLIDKLNAELFNNANSNWEASDYVTYMLLLPDVENNKLNPNGGWNGSMWTWHKSPEGGSPTIAYGFKQGNHPELEQLIEKQGGLYDDLAKAYLRQVVNKYVLQTQNIINNRYGSGVWDTIPPRVQALLVMYQYGTKGGVKSFPNSMDSAVKRQYDSVQREIAGASKAKKAISTRLLAPVREIHKEEIPLAARLLGAFPQAR